MRLRIFATCALAAVLTGSMLLPADSGPQPGQEIPGPFHPYNVSGPPKSRDKFHSFVSEYGLDPVVVVFAQGSGFDQANANLLAEGYFGPAFAKLLDQLDQSVNKNVRFRLNSFVVFVDTKLADVATEDDKREAVRERILAVKQQMDNMNKDARGPQGFGLPLCLESAKNLKDWKLNEEAQVTVVLYREHRVVGSFGFKKDELKDDAIKQVMAAVNTKLLRLAK